VFDDLQGKRVLVTGASTGIGAAAAMAFGRQGARVAVHFHRSRDAADAIVRQIQAVQGEAILVQGNLVERSVPEEVVNTAADRLGGLDVLVNNAGAIVRRAPFASIDEALIDEVFDLNVRSVIRVTQTAVPHLEAASNASIVNVGSIAGANGGGPGSAMYASSKAFIHNLTRHLAGDLAPRGIRVNAIAPGVVKTPFHDATPPERMEAMRKSVLLGRIGQPEECAGAILFFASNAASGYITGQILHINGGQLMP
jgi:3-oxoacyl-[acyl-carrier protein] reductase